MAHLSRISLLLLLVVTVQTARDNPLNGRHLKAIAAELTGTYRVQRDANGNVIGYGGPTYSLLQWLSKSLNFTYEIETLPVFDFGQKLDNGSYTGLKGYIQREESDVALGAFGSASAEPFVEFSFPWIMVDFVILIPFPQEKSKIWAAFQPFQLWVWLAFLLSSCSVVFAMVLYKTKVRDAWQRHLRWGDRAMYLIGVATAQGGYLARRGRSATFLAGLWCLAMFVMVSAYSGVLISFLSVTRLVPTVDSLRDLAEKSPGLLIYTFKHSTPEEVFMNAADGDYKVLGDYLKRNPDFRIQDNQQCLELANKNKGYCITAKIATEPYVSQMWKESGQCLLSRSKEAFFPVHLYLVFNKNSPYHRAINHKILVATATGHTKKWADEENKIINNCLQRSIGAKNQALKLKDLTSAFLVLGIGTVVSSVVFIYELAKKTFFS